MTELYPRIERCTNTSLSPGYCVRLSPDVQAPCLVGSDAYEKACDALIRLQGASHFHRWMQSLDLAGKKKAAAFWVDYVNNVFDYKVQAELEFNKCLIGKYGDIEVYLIDGRAFRETSVENHEFGLSGSHYSFKDIPEGQIYVDRACPEHERPVVILSRLYKVKLMRRSMSNDKAEDKMELYEKKLRQGIYGADYSNKTPDLDKVHVGVYGEIPAMGLTVWKVDGEHVRNHEFLDFIEAGNPIRYKSFIPSTEIWIEQTLAEAEIPPSILHEILEMTIMTEYGLSYDRGHHFASLVEFNNEHITKDEVLGMSRERLISMYQAVKPS